MEETRAIFMFLAQVEEGKSTGKVSSFSDRLCCMCASTALSLSYPEVFLTTSQPEPTALSQLCSHSQALHIPVRRLVVPSDTHSVFENPTHPLDPTQSLFTPTPHRASVTSPLIDETSSGTPQYLEFSTIDLRLLTDYFILLGIFQICQSYFSTEVSISLIGASYYSVSP